MKPAAPVTNARTGPPYRRVALAAAALIAVQLGIRAVLAFGGYFYWDDLILIGKAGTEALLSPSYLLDDHDGHVMPAAFLVAGALTRLAPLVWTGPAISLLVLQLLASLALLRALYVILGWRPVLLIPLTFALFTPLAVPGFAWWAAALNSLPMLAALAWVCADAILLVRTGNQRYAVTGVLVYFGGLLFFEKAAVIPFVAFAVAALLYHVQGDRAALRTVWRAGVWLWTASLTLTVAWVALYLAVVNQQRWSLDLSMTWDLLSRSITHGIVPGLAGGPWHWDRWAPASPWATPGPVVMALGWLVLAGALAVSLLRKQRIGLVWLTAAGYAVACQVPIYLMRSSKQTALELAQTLRYLPDFVVVLALLIAVGFCAPNRPAAARWLDASRRRALVTTGLAVLFVASSLYSTATFLTSWRDNPAQPYLQNARAGLAAAHADFERTVAGSRSRSAGAATGGLPGEPGQPHVRPAAGSTGICHGDNAIENAGQLGPVDQRESDLDPDHRARTDAAMRLFRAAGQARALGPRRSTAAGRLDRRTQLPGQQRRLDDAVADARTRRQSPGASGLNRVYARLPGAGDAIAVRADTTALSLCIASGPVGFLAPV